MINLKELKVSAKNFTVLYVEDDLHIQKIMSKYLHNLFDKVEVAQNGVEGLELYGKFESDIVITDLSMPKMDGIEMIEKIREINSNQPILITTAHNRSKYLIQAIRLGVDGYIIKPFDYDQLNYELFKIVEKLEKFRENERYKKYLQRMIEQKTSELESLISFQRKNYEKTLFAMVDMIEERDTYTAGHSQRVAKYSKMIAKHMGYSEEDCDKIYKAGILHDIGKVATPDVVLLKPKKLDKLEYKLIKEHVNVGYKLLVNIPMFEELAKITRDHHERCDGSGYPRGIKSDEIDPLAKIMMVADAFDAMTTNRIYKGKKSIKDALNEIEAISGSQFDAKVVEAAKVVLKDININEDINQLPSSDIEKERFAYFYKDGLTNLYNKSYLDVTLVQNQYNSKYSSLHLIKIKNFSNYNKKFGWESGNEILQNIALSLKDCLDDCLIFRIFGDDFSILDNGNCDIKNIKDKLESIVESLPLDIKITTLDISKNRAIITEELENI